MGRHPRSNYIMSGIKRTASDKWFSLYIRARDNWTCQRCYKKFPQYIEGGNNRALQGLDTAHAFGRGRKMTRFHPENCLALCYGCHSYIDSDADEKKELWIKHIGEAEYDICRILSKKTFRGYKKELKAISKRYRDLFREINKK